MKKMKRFAYVGAIALLSLLGFSACSSGDDATTDGGLTPQATGEAVKTQFSISLPSEISKMRMTSATVQQAGTKASFRGMQDIVLIPYSNATVRTSRLGANIILPAGKMIKPQVSNAINSIPAGDLLENNNSVLYSDVSIPVGTSGFLFYGKAIGTDGYENGYLNAAGLTAEASSITFTPVPIKAEIVSTKGTALATYVQSIANATNWKGCADPANSAQAWYNAGLGVLWKNFTSMKAGGSAYVQAAVQDLYTSVKDNTDVVSVAIRTAITNSTYVSATTGGVLTFTEGISNYPSADNNDMPDGAAALSWSDDKTTVTAVASSQFGDPDISTQDMAKIVYPASLYYYVDSEIKTSDASQANNYVSTNDWTAILGNYSGTSVSNTTRSIAIAKPIQYAVGRLDTEVNKLSEPTYYDRKGVEVSIPTAGFKLTGVLIGGQKAVDYKFEPSGTTEYTIYDNKMNDAASAYLTATAAPSTNYTLALETAAEQEVYVVLEFENSGEGAADFKGFDGIVKKGCKFYMVAKLKPGDVDTDGTKTGKKVFKQDYTTTAKFTFGAGTADANGDGVSDNPAGFANAYTTIPDLRTPELELGFSVDLTWKEGLTFSIIF